MMSFKPVVIANFISSEKAVALGQDYMKFCDKVNEPGDAAVPLSQSTWGYFTSLELLYLKLPEVSKLIGEPLFPSFTYSRVYKNGSLLPPHKDRDECEISLSVHLCSDKPWTIWVVDESGVKYDVNLNPGDALLYNGIEHEHGRTTLYDGQYYTQTFLHYIRSRGKYSKEYEEHMSLIE